MAIFLHFLGSHRVGDNLDLDQLGASQMHIPLQAMATP
jgi:hypothetical protein